jgi:XTP/dITP diphosphohydrolase
LLHAGLETRDTADLEVCATLNRYGAAAPPKMTALLIATRNAHKAREVQQVLGGDFQYWTLHDFPGAPGAVEDGATFAANAAKKVAALADWLAANPTVILDKLSNPQSAIRNPQSSSPSVVLDKTGRAVPALSAFYVLADDSGLEVDALGGAPGVHSARFAALDSGGADNSPDRANNAKLLRLLEDVPAARRTARFRCVLALRRMFLPPATNISPSDPVGRRSRGAAPGSAETVLFEGVCAGRISLQPAGGGGFGYDPLFIPDGCVQSFAELGEAVKNSLSHRALALEQLRRYLNKPRDEALP